MAHYSYTERKQPKNRQHLGPLEKPKDAKQRLQKSKELKEQQSKLSFEIKQQTNNEYFSFMKKCRKQNDNTIVLLKTKKTKLRGYHTKTKYPLTASEKKTLAHIDLQISVTQKKLEPLCVPKSFSKLVFLNEKESQVVFVDKSFQNSDRAPFQELLDYLHELKELKNRIYEKYE